MAWAGRTANSVGLHRTGARSGWTGRRSRGSLVGLVAGVGILTASTAMAVSLPIGAAYAASNTVTSTVGEGANDTYVGTANFTLSGGSGGSVVVDIAIAVSGDTGAFVCLSPTAFTSRVNPSKCSSPDVFANLASSGGSVTLPASFLSGVTGDTIYAQLHVSISGGSSVATSGGTSGSTSSGSAFAGWTSGTPFYGNVALPLPQTSGAIGPSLIGVAGISLLAVAGAGLVARSRVRVQHSPTPSSDG
jgi:hypothetical protein